MKLSVLKSVFGCHCLRCLPVFCPSPLPFVSGLLWPLLTPHGKPFSTAAANPASLCCVREASPGIHTLFPAYTCPVYCRRSVQLLDFGLFGDLIHAFQPIRTTFTGQRFASAFLQTSPHDDALGFGCILPTAGRIRDFHPLERALAWRTKKGGTP